MGIHIIIAKGEEHNYTVRPAFKTTNNEEENHVLFFSPTIAKSLGTMEVEVRDDSQVVVSQVRGEFATTRDKLKST